MRTGLRATQRRQKRTRDDGRCVIRVDDLRRLILLGGVASARISQRVARTILPLDFSSHSARARARFSSRSIRQRKNRSATNKSDNCPSFFEPFPTVNERFNIILATKERPLLAFPTRQARTGAAVIRACVFLRPVATDSRRANAFFRTSESKFAVGKLGDTMYNTMCVCM